MHSVIVRETMPAAGGRKPFRDEPKLESVAVSSSAGDSLSQPK